MPIRDIYPSFEELKRNEIEGEDYRIRTFHRSDSKYLILAPHGGGIEAGTTEIAESIAEDAFSFATFEGIKSRNNGSLHLTSTCFDEPRCCELASNVDIVVAIHGEGSEGSVVYLGGSHDDLRERVSVALHSVGIKAEIHDNPNLQGTNPGNICNRGKEGAGLQLELSRGLRHEFFESLSRQGRQRSTTQLEVFTNCLREVLLEG